jgi:hypothetical protein
MSYLNQMYSRGNPLTPKQANKNPNRVAGGHRGQGSDSIALLGEDGVERILPTQKYVQALEQQITKQHSAINVLERKLARVQKTTEALESSVASLKHR